MREGCAQKNGPRYLRCHFLSPKKTEVHLRGFKQASPHLRTPLVGAGGPVNMPLQVSMFSASAGFLGAAAPHM